MFKLLHISDLHFGKYYLPKVGEALLEQAHGLQPDVIVISGDLTQRAKEQEFAAAREYLDKLPAVPLVVVPGNHDVPLYRVWERLTRPFGLYDRYIGGDRNSLWKDRRAVVVGLDSTAPHRAVKNGRISRDQLDFCEQALGDLPAETLRIVVFHHHLVPPPTFVPARPMPKAKRLLEMLTHLQVDLVLSGHLHRAYTGNSLDVYAGEEREHGIIVAQCGTTTSRRGRWREHEKNSFNWIQLTRGHVRITHYLYFSERHDFSPVAQHDFVRPGRERFGVAVDLDEAAHRQQR
ncbi:MAG: metallophosphoesterase family protein [Pseudomonadales bacterium]